MPQTKKQLQVVRKSRAQRTPRKQAEIEAHNDIGRQLHAFAGEAYSAALKYYVKHWNNPAALAAFTRALKGEAKEGFK